MELQTWYWNVVAVTVRSPVAPTCSRTLLICPFRIVVEQVKRSVRVLTDPITVVASIVIEAP